MLSKIATRAFKPFYHLYYRSLFGRPFPFRKTVEGWVRRFEEATGRGDVPLSQEAWDAQYQRGDWSFLHRSDELARYSLIVGYLQHAHPGGSVLDIGCGEGILRDQLRAYGYRRYTGIDLSEAAVARGAEVEDENGELLVADAETFQPEERYDAIVFNECVYYFHEPIAGVERYLPFLADGGLLIVSMFRTQRASAIRRQLAEALQTVEEIELTNRKGSWVISVLAPP